MGYLTVSSQPAVNGKKSTDEVFGWGPKDGYVYQKAFLEFFISPEMFEELLGLILKNPNCTFYAANRKVEWFTKYFWLILAWYSIYFDIVYIMSSCLSQGEFKTNVEEEGPCAVTWGVFPGKEIVQPTIVDMLSFKAWKVMFAYFEIN